MKTAPGPKGLPLVGSFRDINRDMLGFFSNCAREYGDVVKIPFGPVDTLFVTNPRDIRYILLENSKNYSKEGIGYDPLRKFLGKGLIFNEGGEFWKRQRKLTQPAFHQDKLENFVSQFNRAATLLIERWKLTEATGLKIDILKEMMRVTLQVAGKTLLGKDLLTDANQIEAALTTILDEADRRARLVTPFSNYLPIPRTFRVRKANRALNELVYRIISERKALPTTEVQHDLLSMYLAARDEKGIGMTDQEVRDEVMSIFIAGHETTANGLAWTWYLLHQNPEIAKKLRLEIDQVLQGREPTIEDLGRLKYAEMVFLEALRIYPPVWIMARRTVSDDRIGKYSIKKGTTVFLSPYVTQRLETYWPDPLKFNPERFAEEGVARTQRFDYFPFAAGPRVCIGQRFAILEAKTLLARIIQNFDLTDLTTQSIRSNPKITLRPTAPICFKLKTQTAVSPSNCNSKSEPVPLNR